MKIVMLDDSPSYIKIVIRLLSQHGHQVLAIDSWAKLAPVIRAEQPGLLILDLDMPSLNGEEVGEIVRRFFDVPILYLSGEAESRLKQVTTKIPRSSYLSKQADVESLLPRRIAQIDTWAQPGAKPAAGGAGLHGGPL